MWPLLVGLGVIAVGSALSESSKQRAIALRKFDDAFTPLPGDRLIAVDEHRSSGGPTIRRFRPWLATAPWELQVATTDDGLEQFAFTFHPGVSGRIWPTIRPARQRPIHLERAFDSAGERSNLAKDGYHANRYRYSHPDEGQVDWFVVRVGTWLRQEPWLFEVPSLYRELVRERPALPAPPALPQTQTVDGVDCEPLSLVPLNAKVYQTGAKVDRVADELAQLRAEIPQLIAAQRRYDESPEALEDRVAKVLKNAAVMKRLKEKIDADDGLDADQKEDLHESLDAAFAQSLGRFKRAIDIELE